MHEVGGLLKIFKPSVQRSARVEDTVPLFALPTAHILVLRRKVVIWGRSSLKEYSRFFGEVGRRVIRRRDERERGAETRSYTRRGAHAYRGFPPVGDVLLLHVLVSTLGWSCLILRIS